MVGKGDKVKVDNPNWCKRCGICIEVCPVEVFKQGEHHIQVKNLDNCIGCENCELSCPDYVLKVVNENERQE